MRPFCLTVILCAFGAAMPADSPRSGTAQTAAAPMLSTAHMELHVDSRTGGISLRDRQTGVLWTSSRLGDAAYSINGRPQWTALGPCDVAVRGGDLHLTFRPHADSDAIRIRLHPLRDGRTLEVALESAGIDAVRLPADLFRVTEPEGGYVIVPVREGLLVPAAGPAFSHRFDTYSYEGCHMSMAGVVKSGSAVLISWEDPYTALDVSRDGGNGLVASLELRKSARALRIRLCGRGDYVTIAKAYREEAKRRGLLVTWKDKLKANPGRARLFGAINFKLWSLLDRRMSEESTREESVRLNWTFDEAAQIAEHLKRDLHIEKALFMVGGWLHRGYDNQHPDILPAAPECGGDAGLAELARRVMAQGFLFCLHDNYQDMYRDAPSWNERFLMRQADGSLSAGGRWAGGRAYLICSRRALELASRPQNLPGVRALTNADSYFIDTTCASGLQECFDAEHPLTRSEDMKYKQALSDYARSLFGIVGSECGREWAIPHSDFFEGLTGVSGRYYHDEQLTAKTGAAVIPLFELVYRDCIALYGKYGYDITKAAEYVLYHIAIGRPLNYHSVPAHLYWKQPFGPESPAPAGTLDQALFTRVSAPWGKGMHPLDRFVKVTYEILSPLYELTARTAMSEHAFLTLDRSVQRSRFGGDVQVIVNSGPSVYRFRSKRGGEVLLPPFGFLVDSPRFVALHALSWGGAQYDAPTQLTARSMDGRPLERSRRVRVFHAFGEPRIRLGDREWTSDGRL